MEFFKNRRTVRRYSARPIDTELLNSMIEAASHAPNTGNMQVYSVVVTTTAEGKKALAPAHFNQPSVEGCAALLTFCVDFNRFEKWVELSGATPRSYDNFQSFVWGAIDTSLFAQQFCTIAEMNGLGCCYLGTTTYNAPQIAEVLNLPERVVPLTTIAVGYPEGDSAVSDRLPLDGIMHLESYKQYTQEDIERIYGPKEALEENKKFVAENSKQSLAQVFTDVRYEKSANEHFSQVFLDFIRKQGF